MNEILPPEKNALTLVEPTAIPTLLSQDKNDILGKLKAELDGYVPDATTPKGRDEIGSKAKRVGVAKQDFVRLAAEQKEEHQKVIKLINAELNVIETSCDELRDAILAPRAAYLQIEKDRVSGHEAAIAGLSFTIGDTDTAETIQDHIDFVKGTFELRDWQEFITKAEHASKQSIAALTEALARRKQYDSDQAELARLREAQAEHDRQEAERQRIAREEQIAAEAAAKARKDAEEKAEREAQAEQARAAAELAAQKALEEKARKDALEAAQRAEKAENDRLAALKKAEDDRVEALAKAERDKLAAVEAEKQRAADAAKAEAEAAAKREQDKKHKAKINGEALAALIAEGLSEEGAKLAVTAIAKGLVPNVKISY